MTQAALDLRDQLAQLPEKDRAALAKFLIDSLDEDVDADADEAWEAELLRREADIRSGKTVGIPAEQAEEALAKLRRKHEPAK